MTEAAQGWLFRTVSNEAFLITPPSLGISLHLLSSSSNSLLFSYFCVSLSPLKPLFLLDCFSLLLIKQGQTGFIHFLDSDRRIQHITNVREEARKRRLGARFQTAQEGPHCSGDWAGSTHSKLLHTMGVFLGGQEPFLLPRRGHYHQAGTWLAPGRSIQQPWAVAVSR